MEFENGTGLEFDTIREAVKNADKKLAMSTGFFIVLEGIDGCGKGTQAKLLQKALQSQYPNRKVIAIREPGSTIVGEQIRKVVLSDSTIVPEAAAYMFFAARAQLAYREIVPALLKGAIVICERWMPSTVSYQGWGGGIAKQALYDSSQLIKDIVEPNLIVLLDVPTKEGIARQNKSDHKPDVFEAQDDYFQRAVALGYENAKTCASVETVSGNGTKEQVLRRVQGYVDTYMRRQTILNEGLKTLDGVDAQSFAAASLRKIHCQPNKVFVEGCMLRTVKNKKPEGEKSDG